MEQSCAGALGSKAARTYTQKYSYDSVGNITKLQHLAGTGSYTRTYAYMTDTNRLKQTKISNGPTYIKYGHDPRGNMTLMPHLSLMAWNTLNELACIANSDMQTWTSTAADNASVNLSIKAAFSRNIYTWEILKYIVHWTPSVL